VLRHLSNVLFLDKFVFTLSCTSRCFSVGMLYRTGFLAVHQDKETKKEAHLSF
jgi:hypothetical protein